MTERWIKIARNPRYIVSSEGRVRRGDVQEVLTILAALNPVTNEGESHVQ